jgi:hypothetical protein
MQISPRITTAAPSSSPSSPSPSLPPQYKTLPDIPYPQFSFQITAQDTITTTSNNQDKNCNGAYQPFHLDVTRYERIEDEMYEQLQPESQDERAIDIERVITDFDLNVIVKHKEYYEKYFLTNFAIKELGVTINKISELLKVNTSKVKSYLNSHNAVKDCHWYHIKTSKIEGVLKSIKE